LKIGKNLLLAKFLKLEMFYLIKFSKFQAFSLIYMFTNFNNCKIFVTLIKKMRPFNNSAWQKNLKNLHWIASPTINLQAFDDESNNFNQSHQVGIIAPSKQHYKCYSNKYELAFPWIHRIFSCMHT
jgi:hypothetical protein